MNELIDEIKRSDRRSISIVVETDGKVVVRAPKHLSMVYIEGFIRSKQDWIIVTRNKMRVRKAQTQEREILKEGLPLFGEQIRVELIESRSARFDDKANVLQLPVLSRQQTIKILEKFYKNQARSYLSDRLKSLATQLGYQVGRFRLSSAKTRWGSCSGKGTISLNWKLALAPISVVDYVIVHELCHLAQMNHSSAFWERLGTHIPNYQAHRDWLKKNGKTLTLEGIKIQ